MRRPLNGLQLEQLRKVNGHFKDVRQFPTKYAAVSIWKWSLSIRHSRDETLILLASMMPASNYRISRMDIALDLLTEDRFDARRLAFFFYRHLCLRYHRCARGLWLRFYDEGRRDHYGLYWGGSNSRRNIALYFDKVSKLSNSSCCHVEYRVISSSAVSAQEIRVIDDLLKFDQRAFIEREFCLFTVRDPKSCNRAVNKFIYNAEQRATLKQALFGHRDVGETIAWDRAECNCCADNLPRQLVQHHLVKHTITIPVPTSGREQQQRARTQRSPLPHAL